MVFVSFVVDVRGGGLGSVVVDVEDIGFVLGGLEVEFFLV